LILARNADEAGVPDAEVEAEGEGEEEGSGARAQHEDDVIDETIFTFESFELVSEQSGGHSHTRLGPLYQMATPRNSQIRTLHSRC
jgi:hypothetical protein